MALKPLVLDAGQFRTLPSATTLQTRAATTANASLNAPHGTAPSSPVDGDFWTTVAGAYIRVNGATVGPLAAAGGGTLNDLTDVDTTGVADGDVLTYDTSSPSGWKAQAPAGGTSYPYVVIRLLALSASVTMNVNSTSYINIGPFLFPHDFDEFPATAFRIYCPGNSTEASQSVTCQLALASAPATPLHTGGNDLQINTSGAAPYDSGWRSIDVPQTGLQRLSVAMKGSSGTVDLNAGSLEIMLRI
jgi:hypothetical protein